MLDLLVSPLFQIVALGVAGIVVWHLQGRSRPTARLLVQIAFFSAMTAILFGSGISPLKFEPMREGGAMLIAAKTLWWVHLAWATIGFVRIYIVLDGRPREARVLQDLIIAVVYLAVTLSVLAFVFDFAIGTLLATSGVIAIILGLALQSTLNDLFSGLALTLGRPYGIGDWIILTDGTEGRVVESTWRSTHILTPANNIVVLPNSFLAKIGLTNISRPDETHLMVLPLRVKPTRAPSYVAEMMRQAMIGANNIVHDPAPVVALNGVDAFAMDIELQFRVRHPADRIPARNELIDLVYRQCIATGISLALPASSSVLVENLQTDHSLPDTLQELLQSNPIFADLKQDELHKLEVSARLRQYRPGDIFFDGADSASSLMIVRSGAASALCDGAEVLRFAPGAIFGQVDGIVPQATKYEALTVLEAYEIDGPTLVRLFRDHPEIQDKLTRHLSGLAGNVSAAAQHAQGEHASILRTVRSLLRK
ncbi:small mechanosensitive ion channel [Phyllobacterium brassicacearum]|uniref:Small-conductance mechanosensitive channel n=1 Tax=Phyllobacterium brassicacearum TaxID=314235 RepID=A0A2P7B723_9HYPH|nr:mechanosensitive ion channel domain-containing protein [Phyllobacterium brassicacearum]PSH62262.1 small mechanosensitive ion channel [Phyllobacterium brassicacearum]TDQ16761.1 small-conductance mechanosensitive channel [Phyllobacterium brassicacearum]